MNNKYGLTPEQFAENLRDNYQRHEVRQCLEKPVDVTMEFRSHTLNPRFRYTPDERLKSTNYLLAKQIASEPLVRKCVRDAFYKGARIDVNLTERGLKEIDENHMLYSVKFIKVFGGGILLRQLFLVLG